MSQLDGHAPALVLRDLTKSFARSRLRLRGPGGRLGRLRYERTVKRVLRGIDLTVDHGEVLGYIGPNGAGKTTTLRMLVGVMHPDSGAVEVYGKSPHHPRTRAQAKRETGSVFGQRSQLWPDLTPKVGYSILGDVYSIPRSEVNRRIHELDEYFGIRDLWDTPVRHLSLGQRMRCDLAAAVLPRPRLLILDEPTIGLDALSKEAFRRFVRHLKAERGTTVLLTTHDMRELGELADRVALVVGGRITFDGSLDDLRKGTRSRCVSHSWSRTQWRPPRRLSALQR